MPLCSGLTTSRTSEYTFGSASRSSTRTHPTALAPNSGFTTAGKPTWSAAAKSSSSDRTRCACGRRQSQTGRDLARADLAARRVDRLRRVAGQPQRGRDPCRHAHAVLPEREHAVGSDAARAAARRGRRCGVVVGVAGRRAQEATPGRCRRRRATQTSDRARRRSRGAHRARPCLRRRDACPGTRRRRRARSPRRSSCAPPRSGRRRAACSAGRRRRVRGAVRSVERRSATSRATAARRAAPPLRGGGSCCPSRS